LRSQSRFPRYRGRHVPFSSLARPDSFSAVPRAYGPVFMFCAPGHVFGRTDGVRSRFHVLRGRTHFRQYRGCRVPFSCFALPESFLAVPRVSDPVFKFCVPGLIFGGTESVGSHFYVLCSRTRFPRYRERRLPFSCFACPDSLSAVPSASGPVFMFCAPGLVFGGTEGVGSRFHVLRSRPCFLRCRVRRVPLLCFVRPDSFSTIPRATGSVFLYCAPGLVFGGTESVGSRFHVLRSQTSFLRCRMRRVPFHVLRARTHFRQKRGCRVPFSCLALPESFLAIPRASGSNFQVLGSRTYFWQYSGHWVPFSSFTRLDSFSAVLRASASVFMFCTSKLVFGGKEGVGSRFHVLRGQTHFRRYRGRPISFSCFALPE
jgi:hypothetical protein